MLTHPKECWSLIYKIMLFVNSLFEQILEYLLCVRYDLGPKDDTVKQRIVSDLVYLN